jgi:hypothetical protein
MHSGDGLARGARHNRIRQPDRVMVTPTRPNRLQIATRMHFVLLRELGQGIDVAKMLKHDVYARDVLLVCDAHRDLELARLAQQYRAADAAPASAIESASTIAVGDSQFAGSSGFGASRPMPPQATAPSAPRTWFDRLMS